MNQYIELIKCQALPNRYTNIYIEICQIASQRYQSYTDAKNFLDMLKNIIFFHKVSNWVEIRTEKI